MSAEVSTAELFEMLNRFGCSLKVQVATDEGVGDEVLFCRMYAIFDTLADKHGIYKVDTIGDGTTDLISYDFFLESLHP
jgi:hypothetical protein